MEALSEAAQRLILHWGELGTRWGLNRSVAQIHALLFLSKKPLPADEIAVWLSLARSNVSSSLRELQGWGIVRVVHLMGDRRDHFESLKDFWEMFYIILDERKRREVDPTLAVLRDCATDLAQNPEDAHVQRRVGELLGFFEEMTGLYEEFRRMPGALRQLVRFKGQVRKMLSSAAS
jgi:DNA-binding transcriptional regulator GbsR (MarR family)